MAVEYSLLVWDDNFQEVHNVMKKYGITLKKADFAGDRGFTFNIVENDGIGSHPIIGELHKMKNVSITRQYGAMDIPISI